MNNEILADKLNYTSAHADLEGFDSLAELALDLRWSWNHGTDGIWQQLDSVVWEQTHHPWSLLQTITREKIKSALADPAFRSQVDALVQSKKKRAEASAWFQQSYPQSPLTCVAYFSMEFMVSEALPIYSGGLGNVAGDQLKAASDLGVPVVGVGLLFSRGYFHQDIDKNGAQQGQFPYNDPARLPVTPVRYHNGDWVRFQIPLPGQAVWLRVWQVLVGRVKLYLLDSNDEANTPAQRGITGELYGGGPEMRLQQELLLGIGGWRLFEALGLQADVCHLNEGHAAFAVLERAHSFMEATGQSFAIALAVTRAGNIFTTHTAVDAGFDLFSPALMEQYLGGYARERLGISCTDLLALGRQDSNNTSEPFNMAFLAIRGSGSVNGVSRLHGQVSRNLFRPLFPHWPADEVSVGHVTNGVHMSTWDSTAAGVLWTEVCGKDRWLGTMENLTRDMRGVSDERLWQLRTDASKTLVEYARKRLSEQVFDPKVLTLGFAKRFTAYKRPNLLLHDPERLLRLLTHAQRPVQLILAGKAHPADGEGQALIQEWIHFIRRPEARVRAIFLNDYDMSLAGQLVRGVDVWLNTPRRPWEACGTSGMKVLVNGGLNLSELDGWWAEAYTPEVGWALGDGREHGHDPAWDAREADALYGLLEREVVPEFYARDGRGIPVAWVKRIRESMAQLTPRFSANRAVREYTEQHYIPAALAYRKRADDKGAVGRHIVDWEQALKQKWAALHFGDVKVKTENGQHIIEVQICLADLDPKAIRVELYADGVMGSTLVRQEMTYLRPLTGPLSGGIYSATVSAVRPPADYTARVIPNFDGVTIPLENAKILWQR